MAGGNAGGADSAGGPAKEFVPERAGRLLDIELVPRGIEPDVPAADDERKPPAAAYGPDKRLVFLRRGAHHVVEMSDSDREPLIPAEHREKSHKGQRIGPAGAGGDDMVARPDHPALEDGGFESPENPNR
jgi:hypothetical protein